MGISFKPYERAVELNTSQARTNVNITPTAYGVDQSGMSNLNKAIGTVASNIQQMEEEKLAIEVTDATNQYNMKVNDVLHNPENGLFNLEGKNAEGVLSAFQVKEKEIREQILKERGFKNEKALKTFNQIADNSVVTVTGGIEKHQSMQRKAYLGDVWTNKMTTAQNLLLTGEKTRENIQRSINDVTVTGAIIGKQLGYDEEKIKLETKKSINGLIGSALENSIQKEDFTEADGILANSSGLVDEETLMGYRAKVNKVRDGVTTKNIAESAYSQFGDNVDGAVDFIMKSKPKATTGGAGKNSVNYAKSKTGMPYSLGADGSNAYDCGLLTQEATAKAGYNFNYRTADGQYLQAEKEGKTTTDLNQLKDGSLVFWHVPNSRWQSSNDESAVNSDSQAYKGITHVGIYNAETGKVIQAGSSGVGEIPVDTYQVVGIANVVNDTAQQGGELNDELEKEKARDAYMLVYSREKQKIAIKVDTAQKEVRNTLLNNPNWSTAEQLTYVRQVAGDDEDLKEGLFTMINGLQNNLKAEAKQAEREAKEAMKADFAFMHNVKVMYENGSLKNKQEVSDFIAKSGKALTAEQIVNLDSYMNDKDTGKDADVEGYMGTIKNQLGVNDGLWNTWKPSMKVLLKQQVAEYEKANNGQRPSDNEIVQMGVNLATEKSTNLVVEKGGMFTADKQLYLSDVQTKKWGYSHYDVLDGTGYIRFYNSDGSYVDVHSVDVYKKIQDERSAGY